MEELQQNYDTRRRLLLDAHIFDSLGMSAGSKQNDSFVSYLVFSFLDW